MGRCPGAFAEFALMEAAEAINVPPALSWEEAASLPLTFLVAFDMLVLQGRLKSGDWLLVNGVSSGVGVDVSSGVTVAVLGTAVAVSRGVAVAVSSGVAVAVADDVGVGDGVTVSDGVAVADAVAVAVHTAPTQPAI